MQPKIVLLSSGVDEKSGWGRFTREFCHALYRKGIPFELHLPQKVTRQEALPFSQQIRYDLFPPHLTFERKWYLLADLVRGIRGIHIDGHLIHSLIEFPYGVLARWLSHRFWLPFGITLHGTYAVAPLEKDWLDRFLHRPAVKEADFIVAVSRFTRERFLKALGSERPVAVINNGVDTSRFSTGNFEISDVQQIRKKFGIQENDKLILCVGALKPRKGIDVLLKVFSSVVSLEPSAYLVIIGSGDTAPYLDLARRLDVLSRVLFLQSIEDDQILAFYNACDVFAMLPREDENGHFEGFGLVYLEANACGKPVVGTLSGGVGDAIRDGETGFLVPPDNPEAAAQAILEFLRNKELAERIGQNGRIWAEQHAWLSSGGTTCVIEDYLELYDRVLQCWRR